MPNTERNQLRTLGRELATHHSPTRRAQAAAALRRVLSREMKKAATDKNRAMLRVATEIFRFLEELPWQGPQVPDQKHKSGVSARSETANSRMGLSEAHLAS